ncbi:MAG: lysophospholipid acyltransferase family protein [Spirochaetes bacterium]|nr:lysophospholipid acyltransferase family protein [Spirochaetota bacterium]
MLSYAASCFVRLLYLTYRIKIINENFESGILGKSCKPIYVSWHQRFFPGIMFLSKRKPIAIIVSPSKDGDLISKIVERFGWSAIRGSSSRGGSKAYREIKELAKKSYSLGHIVDGPRGPFGVIKPGLMMLAGKLGMPVLPVIISAEKKWMFSSWDRFIIPKPFSRIIIRFEQPVNVPYYHDRESFDKERLSLERKLYVYYDEADRYWEG